MFNLCKTELLRHRWWACGVAVLHFMALYYVYTLGQSVLRASAAVAWMLVCMTLSAGFGILQMNLHTRDNDWLYLLHRPLPPRKIFLALTLAGSGITLLLVVVPLALIVVVMHLNQNYGVEGRHYLSVLHAVAAALTSYWCGCFAALSASRIGFLALSMSAAFLIVRTDSTLLPGAILLPAWALLLAWTAFKPDRSQPPARIGTLLLTELPIQSGCLLLITMLTWWMSASSSTLSGNDPYRNPRPGTDFFVRAMPAKDAMQMALDQSSHADVPLLHQQVLLGEALEVRGVSFNSYPHRRQLAMVDEALILPDNEPNILWRFRHDAMLFQGRETDSARFVGWLGPDGFSDDEAALPATRFDSVPWVASDQLIISDNDIYQITWNDRKVHHRYHDGQPDRFNNSLTLGENTATLFSDSNLYLFDSVALRDPTITLLPKAVLAVPSSHSPDLRKLAVLPLRDGFLVSALLHQTPYSGAPDFALLGRARLQLYRLRHDAEAELIADVPLPSGSSDWFLYRTLVLTPGVRLFNDLVSGLRQQAGAEYTLPPLYLQFPLKIWLATALVCLLCAGTTAWLLRRSTLPRRIQIFWIAANGITGLAGLTSFIVGYYWKRHDLLVAEIGSAVITVPTAADSASLRYNH